MIHKPAFELRDGADGRFLIALRQRERAQGVDPVSVPAMLWRRFVALFRREAIPTPLRPDHPALTDVFDTSRSYNAMRMTEGAGR